MNDPPQLERDLISRFRSGDAQAFRVLVEPHRRALEACVRRRLDPRVRRRVSVSDVIQDAHVVAYDRRADFDGRDGSDLRRWLLGIAAKRAHKAVEQHAHTDKRDVGREVTRTQRPATAQLRRARSTPSQLAAAKELASMVARARVVLTTGDAELLRLVHDEGLSLKAAAERVGSTHEAVRKQHARALRRLGQALRRLKGERDDSI